MTRAPPWSRGSVLDHRSLPPVFESRRGHIWRLFRLSLRFITFGSRSAHLAYLVHRIGRKNINHLNHFRIYIRVFLTKSHSSIYLIKINALCLILSRWLSRLSDSVLFLHYWKLSQSIIKTKRARLHVPRCVT